MRKLKRGCGNWVDGDRFWARENELESFSEYLDEGAHLLIVAPRRIGKTSLLHEAQRRYSSQYDFLLLDLERCHSAEDLVVELSLATRAHQGLWAKTKDVFRNTFASIIDRVDEIQLDDLSVTLRAGISSDWQPKATRLLAELASASDRVVICLDEFPILVSRLLKGHDFEITPQRRATTDTLVSWLRSMSTLHRGAVRFVLAGSIGLEPILRQGGLSGSVTTFTPFHLDPWDRATAIGCLEALGAYYAISFAPKVLDRIADRLGCWIPHHVQLYFDLIYEDCRRRGVTVCELGDVDRVYDTRMLGSRGHPELSQLEERLKTVFGARLMPLAVDLLTEAAVSGRLTAVEARLLADDHLERSSDPQKELREVLQILEHDVYLVFRGDAYELISPLVRDWWGARFGFGFTRARERKTG